MKSKLKKFFIVLFALIVSATAFTGCHMYNEKVVVSIEKTVSDEFGDTYTISYSDGTSETIEIKHGQDGQNGANGLNGADGQDGVDGQDGQDLAIDQLFDKWLELNPGKTYDDFLTEFLQIDASMDNSKAVNKALASSARVYCEYPVAETVSGIPTGNVVIKHGQGSAVIVKRDANYTYFITNYHVVYNTNAYGNDKHPRKIVLNLYGSEQTPTNTGLTDGDGYYIYNYGDYGIDATLIGGAATKDIAILRATNAAVDAVNANATAIEFADDYRVGERVFAIGNPAGGGISASEGVVSVDCEYINLYVDSELREYRAIRIDAAIYNGSSGGGLFNKDGKLVGITNAGEGTEYQNISFAIPVQIVRPVATSIIENYDGTNKSNPTTLVLGISVQTSGSKYVYDAETGYGKIQEKVTLSDVASSSVASSLGLNVGDQILSIYIGVNEYSIYRNFNIGDCLVGVKTGDKVKVKYSRGGIENTTAEYTVTSTDIVKIV